jgi:hypothetical protein
MKRLILLTILLMGLITAQVDAATYYVGTTGNDGNVGSSGSPWRTLGKAAATMVAGDTTIVKNGTYTESQLVFINASGTAGARITLRAENQYLAILSSTSSCNPSISLYASYITIDGLRLTVSPSDVQCTSGSTAGYQIHAWNANEPKRGGNESSGHIGAWIKNVQFDADGGHRTGAIKTRQDDTLIENNVMQSDIEPFNADNVIVRNNLIFGPFGVTLKGGTRNAQVYNNVIHITSSSYARGIYLGGCTGAPWFFDTVAKIENYNAVVYNNVVIADVVNATNVAFMFRSDSNSKVFNNVSVNINPVEMTLSCTLASPLNTNANPTFENNIMIGNGANTVASLTTFSGTKTIDYNNFYNFSSGVPTQAHAITGNPNLVNNASNWRPQAGSPVIQSGTTITMRGYNGENIVVNVDKDGATRTVPWDLGIYATNGVASDMTPPGVPDNLRIQ